LKQGITAVTGACDDGFNCPEGSEVPRPLNQDCPKNHYCAGGVETDCPANTFTFENTMGATIVEECMYCLPGKLCTDNDDTVSDCPGGSYCVDGIQTTCNAGYFCPEGTSIPMKCARGYYSSANSASCSECGSGDYCPDEGMSSGLGCDSTKICTANADTDYPSVKPTACTYGEYATGNTCQPCPAGNWCWPRALGISSISSTLCNEGFVCQGGSDSPTPFWGGVVYDTDSTFLTYNGRSAVGYYSDTTLGTDTNHPCPPGSFQNSEGSSLCISCPRGYFCDTAAIYSLSGHECEEGYVCLGGSASSTPTDDVTGKQCPQYYHCPQATAIEVPCENGKYAPNVGMADCIVCEDGHFCNYDGVLSVAPTPCSTDNVCVEGKSFEPVCPIGRYSDSGVCESCPRGKLKV
jgi:hypothetical protein